MSESRSERTLRICFVCIEAYATLRPGVAAIAGGAGFQVVQLGRRLRDLGHEVSYVVGDFGQPAREEIDGFVVHRASRIGTKRSLIRGPANLLRVWRAMRAARADHYILRGNWSYAGFVLVFARLLGARYAFMVADMNHVFAPLPARRFSPAAAVYAWSLRRADLVTVQSNQQRHLLAENYGVRGVLVPNGIDVPPLEEAPAAIDHDVVWVGSVKPIKRPDRLLAVAQALPDRSFLVVGGPGEDRGYYEQMVARFAAQANLTWAGYVPPDQVADMYRRGRLYLLTSNFEGFPNAFLHAWALGIPVCSLDVDPDHAVAERNLGLVDPDPERLAARMAALLDDPAAYTAMRVRCHGHARERHSLENSTAALLTALRGDRSPS